MRRAAEFGAHAEQDKMAVWWQLTQQATLHGLSCPTTLLLAKNTTLWDPSPLFVRSSPPLQSWRTNPLLAQITTRLLMSEWAMTKFCYFKRNKVQNYKTRPNTSGNTFCTAHRQHNVFIILFFLKRLKSRKLLVMMPKFGNLTQLGFIVFLCFHQVVSYVVSNSMVNYQSLT